ncbi:hypothetical protein WJX73_006113 [Symbiochloris irregularis]|uniref:Uncharacterized protein n=1 Tax=Symbiochloris irregularis TaxID=706552 RepID=A0AAW1P4I7_9CHLO
MEAIVGTALSAVGSAATLGLQQYAASQKRQEEREAEQLALKKARAATNVNLQALTQQLNNNPLGAFAAWASSLGKPLPEMHLQELDDPAEGTSTLINRLDYPIEGITSLLSV